MNYKGTASISTASHGIGEMPMKTKMKKVLAIAGTAMVDPVGFEPTNLLGANEALSPIGAMGPY